MWPSLQADFMLVETYKVGFDSDAVMQSELPVHAYLIRLWRNCIQLYFSVQDLAWRAMRI